MSVVPLSANGPFLDAELTDVPNLLIHRKRRTSAAIRLIVTVLCLAATRAAATAQGFPRDIPGITATGRATLIAHADRYAIDVVIAPSSPSGDDLDRAGAALVDALRSVGIRDASSAAFFDPAGQQTDREISGNLANPTTESLANIARIVTSTLAVFPASTLRRLSGSPGLSDCADVEGRLHAAAVKDARARAERLAAAAGVTLGEVPTIITPGGLPNYAFPCAPSRDATHAESIAAGALPVDGNVTFGLFVNVTYPIVGH
jgi:uncharacterized protein YggE